MNQVAYFTAQDVAYVRSSQAPEAKIAIAEKLGFHFRQFPRHSSTFQLAVEIAMLLQKDASQEIRLALSESVARETKTPAILATMLATDPTDMVAIPVLKHSPRLTDALLLPLIQATRTVARLTAIAEREKLSAQACQALIEKKIQDVCLRVLELHMEILDGNGHLSLVRHYGQNLVVMRHAMQQAHHRGIALPAVLGIAIQEAMQQEAANDDSRPAALLDASSQENAGAEHSFNHTEGGLLRWKETMKDIHLQHASTQEMEHWIPTVEQMNREGALQAPTMLLSLGLGLMPLFAAGLARHSRVSLEEAVAACSGSEQDFRELYQRSHFPSAMYKLCWWALSSARELLARGTPPCSEEMKKGMARKLAQAEKLKINFARTVGTPVMDALLRDHPPAPALAE